MKKGGLLKPIKEASKQTLEHPYKKFLIVLTFLLIYLFTAVLKFGFSTGSFISFLTWSFFVLCTPIADAGILIDFPIRLLFHIKMVFSEIIVWIIAIVSNILALTFSSEIYDRTILLKLFHHILTNPFPFWGIILLSGIGTFLSVHLGDELISLVSKNKPKDIKYLKKQKIYELIILVFIIAFTILTYYFLIRHYGLSHPPF